jgi:hypothetical protein
MSQADAEIPWHGPGSFAFIFILILEILFSPLPVKNSREHVQ